MCTLLTGRQHSIPAVRALSHPRQPSAHRPIPPASSRRLLLVSASLLAKAAASVLCAITVMACGAFPPPLLPTEPAPAITPTPSPVPTHPRATQAPTEPPTQLPVQPSVAPSLGATWTRPDADMLMVFVPAGEFQMGSTDAQVHQAIALCNQVRDCQRGWFDHEQPVHTVVLDGFWIDRTEATNAQYRRCVQAGECDPPVYANSYTRESYYQRL